MMKKIGILCKRDAEGPLKILEELIPWIEKQGHCPLIEQKAAERLGREGYAREEIPPLADFIIVLGGDGTMLGAARLIGDRGVPLLGVNLGRLGFITEVNREDLYGVMNTVLSGSCPTEERIVLTASLYRESMVCREFAVLNDVVINKAAIARIIDIETHVNGTYVSTFRADGMIVSTPTGSTAYCLSAGGPILYPTLKSIVMIPICPHTLTNRPLVLPDDVSIDLIVRSEHDDVFLTLDGQEGMPLRKNDVVRVMKPPFTMRMLIPCRRDYFRILREKLRWGER